MEPWKKINPSSQGIRSAQTVITYIDDTVMFESVPDNLNSKENNTSKEDQQHKDDDKEINSDE